MKFLKISFLLTVVFIASCTSSNNKIPAFNRSFSTYIASFTNGVISKKSTIHIAFTKALSDTNLNDELLEKDLLEFDPSLKGKLVLSSQNSLEFIPEEDLKPGQVYTAKLKLSELMEVPDSLEVFDFGFQILRPDFEWGSVQLLATPESQMTLYKLQGTVLSADEEHLEDLDELIKAEFSGQKLRVTWEVGKTPLQYIFEVDSLKRQDEATTISLTINKDVKGSERLGDKKLELAALGDFKYVDYALVKNPSSHVRLNFSDPIDKSQDLSGLITLEEAGNLRFEIENTAILVFPERDVYGIKELNIFPGIKNILGFKFKVQKTLKIEFLNEKPQVKIIGKGNIIPLNDKLMLPFQAISLKAVDVKVVKVPENNILQFLQTNSLGGEHELYRVGELVATKKIDLITEGSLKDWNTYSVDLSALMKPEAGAMYRVYISFTQDYSIYECFEEEAEAEQDEDDYWYYDDYYYYESGDYSAYNRDDYYFTYPRGYRWKERDNPCHASYYRSEQFVTRNLFATNLGFIVKRTEEKELDFTVSDMVSNSPVSGAEITLYNYQGRKLSSVSTDRDGFAKMPFEGRPYFVVASKGAQKTYLKIQEGEALSLSNFQVGGSSVADGLKGFVYGERGVWRPGDTIFLKFILEDELNRLPNGHPIHFTLTNPQGQMVDKQVAQKQDLRIYNFTTKTNGSSVTGNYSAKVRLGDRVFNHRVRVETVKPNRLKIDLEFEDEILEMTGGDVKAKLAVHWLTGVPSANSKVKIDANMSALYNGFDGHEGYIFYDPVRAFRATEKTVFDDKVNSEGKADIELDMGNLSNAPGMIKSRFVMKAFEGGGDFSIEYVDKKIAPFKKWVGIKMPKPKRGYYLETDEDFELKIRTVDAQGKPISMNNLQVKVYKIDWHWWYNSESENLARFTNNEVTYLVSKGSVNTVNGDGTYKLRVDYPNWGRFLVRVCDPNSGHCTGQVTYFDWPAGKKGNRPELAGATMLSFSADKEKYKIGDEIVTTIPVSENAKVLITVETGSGIIKKEWVKAKGDMLEYRLKATAEMAPNIYISASLLQPHAQTTNDRPMRLYGVIPIEVYDPQTELEPVISSEDVWRPETKVKVKVSEKNNRSMSYTLAVVDEGLLNLTNFKTPDPWTHFYAKEALGVKTWDMYNDVLGAFGGRLEQVFAVGGDGALGKMENSNLNRFVPMVRVLGPFKLKAGGSTTHEISVPNYVGSARILVVAADDKTAYGNAEKSVKVRKPLMVLTTLPRVLSPGDEVTLPVTVFAMEDQVRSVSLKLKVEGDVDVVGESVKKVQFTKNGEQVIDFKLKVPEVRGDAVVRVEATSGKEQAYDEVKLRVRLPNPPVTKLSSFTLKPGKDTTLTYEPIGVEQTNSMSIEASTIPRIDLNKRLHYLFGYPYGCTEQTVSRAFPLLYLEDIMELTDDMKATKKQNVQIALQKIYERQTGSGLVRYWPGSYTSHYNDYITSYAGHFMIEAEKKGFQLGAGVMARWKKYQQTSARTWKPIYNTNRYINNEMVQAYRLYTLALHQSAEVGAMNRMRELENLQAPSLWYLAATYMLIGQKDEAAKLAERADKVDYYNYYGYWYYGGNLRNMAIELMVLNDLGRKTEALQLGREVAKQLSSEGWYTTHSLAFGLVSFVKTYGEYAKKSGDLSWKYKAGAEEYVGNTKGTFQTYEVKNALDDPKEYTLRNTSSVPVNYTVTTAGTPISYDLPSISSNLSMQVKYMDANGNSIDETRIKQGQDFVVEVSLSRQGNEEGYDNMALSQMFPTGWEIINTRLLEVSESDESAYDYKDIRDDRVYTFFGLRRNYTSTYRVRLNATYAGKYFLPPVEASDMYNDNIKARVPGKWVEVVR